MARREPKSKVGDVNKNQQLLVRLTGQPSDNHPWAKIVVVRCLVEGCGDEYGAHCDLKPYIPYPTTCN
jgi:hypothetical protein